MKETELIPGKHYIGIDKDGRKFDCVKVDDYVPGGVIFSCFPSFTIDGELNDLIDFEEYPNND